MLDDCLCGKSPTARDFRGWLSPGRAILPMIEVISWRMMTFVVSQGAGEVISIHVFVFIVIRPKSLGKEC